MCAGPGPLPALVLTTWPGAGGAEELGWKALPGEARSEPGQHPPPPLSLSWPVILDLSDLPKRFCVSWDLGTFCLPCYSLFLSFTAHLGSSRIGCSLSPPFIILGTSHSTMYSSESSRCGSCLSTAESLSSPHTAMWLCLHRGGDWGPESPGASCRVCDDAGRDLGFGAKPSSWPFVFFLRVFNTPSPEFSLLPPCCIPWQAALCQRGVSHS